MRASTHKTTKFAPNLVPLVLSGEKTATWRLFDDKDLQAGDIVTFINKATGEEFAVAKLTSVKEKPLGSFTEADWAGHERFTSEEEMYVTYETYYHRPVTAETVAKIIHFELIESSPVEN